MAGVEEVGDLNETGKVSWTKKYKPLDTYGAGPYDQLHKLRKCRDKVHIQSYVRISVVPREERKLSRDGIDDFR